jgi:hypothetical protein
MSAQPVDEGDPRDPQVILGHLPERARVAFLEEYRAAVRVAVDPAGYRGLQEFLQSWSVRAVAYAKPDFEERYEDLKADRGEYVTLDEVLARRPPR